MMVNSRSIDGIAHEISDSLKPYVFETFTENCNMDVVEYALVESELSRFCYYEQYYWNDFENGETPDDEGYYWLTVLTQEGERKVVLTKWYGRDSLYFWKRKFQKLLAWKACILPEPYMD